jgi:hypothetical protein
MISVREAIPEYPDGTTVRAIELATGLSNRAVRDEMDRLLESGEAAVCTLPVSTGKSVYIATEDWQMDLAIKHIASKAGALLVRKRRMRFAKDKLAWSPTLFPVD